MSPPSKSQNSADQLQNEEIVTDAKITVIGDSWQQLLILPEETPLKTKRKSQGSVVDAGAARMRDLISAATGANGGICSIRYFPISECADQVMTTVLLKECEPEKDTFNKLRHLNFREDKIPEKPLRVDRTLGTVPIPRDLGRKPTEPTKDSHKNDDHKYLVIYDDCLYDSLYSENPEKYQKDKTERYEQVIQPFLSPSQNEQRRQWILWHPRHLWDHSLDDMVFRSLVENNPSIKEQLIVFLRVDDLADAGIGQRGDCSIEECLEGILDEIEQNEALQLLNGCAAVVIENGVDSAFLLQLGKDGKIEHCQIFFRTNRTSNAYRQNNGYIQGLGSFMVVSCLKAIIDGEDKLTSCLFPDLNIAKFGEVFINNLSDGIKDGLGRMLVKFNIGYPRTEKDLQNHFKWIYEVPKLPSPDETKDTLKQCIDAVVKEESNKDAWSTLCSELKNRNFFNEADEDIRKHKAKKIIKIVNEYCVHKCKPEVSKIVTEDTAAAYISRFFQFPESKLFYTAPWLLELQWKHVFSDFKDHNDFLDAIVKYGLKNLEERGTLKFPVARFGKMEVVEPDEISMFRRLDNLIRKYVDSDTKIPLGIAVFGAPGSGKSFGIKEVAGAVTGDINLFEYNLAQFKNDPEELYVKLLEVRNSVKENPKEKQLPIIFLDEFDTTFGEEHFGWCKFLLSVLQDGTFRYQRTLYDVGKALVVCAGGLCHSFREFERRSQEKESRDAKVPDLISRLRGYVDIAGPNPYFPYPQTGENTRRQVDWLSSKLKETFFKQEQKQLLLSEIKRTHQISEGGELSKSERGFPYDLRAKLDPLYKIRRAVLLRSVLKAEMPFIYNENNAELAIGPRVLRALLDIPEYKYGTRSMRAIIAMSVLICRESRRFTTAMLPPPEQLEMHVDAAEFYKIIAKASQKEKTGASA